MTEAELQNHNNKLPAQVRRLIRLIGWGETFKLLKQLGGLRVYIPIKPNPLLLLREALSPETIQALVREYGMQNIDLPKIDKIILELRDLEILRALETRSQSEVAAAYGLTERQVRYIRAARTGGGSVSP